LPNAPRNLVGQVQGPFVSLAWSPPSGGSVAGYVIEAGTSPGATNLAQVPVSASTTSISAPVGFGTYYVRVRAFNTTPAAGPASNEVTLNVNGGATPAAQPQNFRVSVSGSSVTFSWNPPSPSEGVTDYVLDAGTAAGASNLANALPLGAGFNVTIPN